MNEFQSNWVIRDTFEELLATAKLRLKLLRRAKAMLEIGMPHLVELIEEIDSELADE